MALRERLTAGLERLEEATGYAVERRERLELLEASDSERRALQKELDLLAYTALDYAGGQPQDLKPAERRKLAQKARVVWMRDPQAGAAVDLMNDFVFGRGIPKPKARDKLVQEVIDEAWEDPDNQLALTSYEAQLALGIDLSLQSNLFILIFDDGEDGKVKLGLLDHDAVERVVRDEAEDGNWLRILYYVAKQSPPQEEDFERGEPKANVNAADKSKTVYFAHYRHVDLVREEAERGERKLPKLAPERVTGDGKVLHVAINKTTRMAFGHPVMDRLLRWFNAYNRFMDARVDLMEASAAFIMKRKVKGTPNQLSKMATQALSRRSALGSSAEDGAVAGPKRAGALLSENEEVTHEPFNLSTNATNAAEDARMLGGQVSAVTRFPRSYFGDAGASNLATATSLELPVLKAVETRQEVFENVVRAFVDRVIERAVDSGRIPSDLTDEERDALRSQQDPTGAGQAPAEDPVQPGGPVQLTAGYEDQGQDETATERDLSYEFSMPNPLRRMMGELIGAIMNVARTFDPNNTNVELSRTLLTIALGDGLELEDPASAVERIFPEGYQDPALAQAPGGPPGGPFGEFGPPDGQLSMDVGGAGGRPPGGPGDTRTVGPNGDRATSGNPYGTAQRALPPELAMAESAATRRVPADVRRRLEARRAELDEDFEALVDRATDVVLTAPRRRGDMPPTER